MKGSWRDRLPFLIFRILYRERLPSSDSVPDPRPCEKARGGKSL